MAGQDQTDLHRYSLKSNKNLLQLIFQLALQMGHCHAVAFLPKSPTGWETLVRLAFFVLMQFPKLLTCFSYTSNLSETSPQAIGMQKSIERSTSSLSQSALNQLQSLRVSQTPAESSPPCLCFYCCCFVFVFACN